MVKTQNLAAKTTPMIYIQSFSTKVGTTIDTDNLKVELHQN